MRNLNVDPQCDFCFDTYGELMCEFYVPKKPEFEVTSHRNGKAVVCECCDHSDTADGNEEEAVENDQQLNEIPNKLNSEEEDESRDEGLLEKRAKLQMGDGSMDQKENSVKVQAGWYGKGYRKLRNRKKKS